MCIDKPLWLSYLGHDSKAIQLKNNLGERTGSYEIRHCTPLADLLNTLSENVSPETRIIVLTLTPQYRLCDLYGLTVYGPPDVASTDGFVYCTFRDGTQLARASYFFGAWLNTDKYYLQTSMDQAQFTQIVKGLKAPREFTLIRYDLLPTD
jgi:hypothetical protein